MEESIKPKVLHFEYCNETRREHARREKIESVKVQNFELAASWREKEKSPPDILR